MPWLNKVCTPLNTAHSDLITPELSPNVSEVVKEGLDSKHPHCVADLQSFIQVEWVDGKKTCRIFFKIKSYTKGNQMLLRTAE